MRRLSPVLLAAALFGCAAHTAGSRAVGFEAQRWVEPADSGFYQPVFSAIRP